jgi:hypothetical protein
VDYRAAEIWRGAPTNIRKPVMKTGQSGKRAIGQSGATSDCPTARLPGCPVDAYEQHKEVGAPLNKPTCR